MNSFQWWSGATFRISHPTLDVDELGAELNREPTSTDHRGTSKGTHGPFRSPSTWKIEFVSNEPHHPEIVFRQIEAFANENRDALVKLLEKGCYADVYVGIHTYGLVLGFVLPTFPTLTELGIQIGVEIF